MSIGGMASPSEKKNNEQLEVELTWLEEVQKSVAKCIEKRGSKKFIILLTSNLDSKRIGHFIFQHNFRPGYIT